MVTRRLDDGGVSAVVGAIVVLAVLGFSILYVNAYEVPRQGGALEADARNMALEALAGLAAHTADEPASVTANVPLRAERPAPPLLSGVILAPLRDAGSLTLRESGTTISVSHLVDAPATGVPTGDVTREAEDGRMRVYLVGNAAQGVALGALHASPGALYMEPVTLRLEGGAVFATRASGTSLVQAPALSLTRQDADGAPVDHLKWRIPLLRGEQQVSGVDAAEVRLSSGQLARAGGQSTSHEMRIVVETGALAAWNEALEEALGPRASVSAIETADDAGVVTAIVGGDGVGIAFDLSVARYEAALTGRSRG